MDFAVHPLGSTSGFSAFLVIAVQKKKKNLEWESWVDGMHHGAMGAEQEEPQGFYKTLKGQGEKERRKKEGK